jgi:hypothetical protein
MQARIVYIEGQEEAGLPEKILEHTKLVSQHMQPGWRTGTHVAVKEMNCLVGFSLNFIDSPLRPYMPPLLQQTSDLVKKKPHKHDFKIKLGTKSHSNFFKVYI